MTDTPMDREPVRIPLWIATAAAVILPGLVAWQATGDLVAVAVAILGVLAPSAVGIEYARSRAWSPASVATVTNRAAEHAARRPGDATPPPEILLDVDRWDPYRWVHPAEEPGRE